MDDYLSKPIRPTDLVKLLERVNSNTMAAPWAERDTHVAVPVSTRQSLGTPASNQRLDNIAVLDIEQLQDLRYLPSAPGEATFGALASPLPARPQPRAGQRPRRRR